MVHAQRQTDVPKVVVKKLVSAPPERVFDAWTRPELMEQWLYPGTGRAKTRNDLRVGGEYSHDMITSDAGSCGASNDGKPGEKHYLHTGTYLEIRKPERLVFTWSSPSVKDTRVTIELRPVGEATEVTITHELLDSESERTGHTRGWEGCLQNLAAFVG